MTSELQQVLKLLSLTNRFKRVLRNQFVPETQPRRYENDAEHTMEIVLAAWYLNQACNLDLDSAKLMKYAIAHDLIEIFTEDLDPFMHSGDPDYLKKKAKMEEAAMKEFESEFGDAPEIIQALKDYEQKADKESKFIYAIDKVIAQVNVTEMEKRTLENCGISRASLVAMNEKKLIVDDFSYQLGQELLKIWDQREGFYADNDYIPEYKKSKKTI